MVPVGDEADHRHHEIVEFDRHTWLSVHVEHSKRRTRVCERDVQAHRHGRCSDDRDKGCAGDRAAGIELARHVRIENLEQRVQLTGGAGSRETLRNHAPRPNDDGRTSFGIGAHLASGAAR